MDEVTVATCKLCKFYEFCGAVGYSDEAGYMEYGECRYNPPTYIHKDSDQFPDECMVVARFPFVDSTDWCGKWEACG